METETAELRVVQAKPDRKTGTFGDPGMVVAIGP
jgi:hypothetical protein